MKAWLLSGPMEHWRLGIEKGGKWGVNEGHVVKSCWEKASPGDVLYFYATDPIKCELGFCQTPEFGIFVGISILEEGEAKNSH